MCESCVEGEVECDGVRTRECCAERVSVERNEDARVGERQ